MAHLVPASDRAIASAAGRLRSGEPVAFPTETVYGMGADTYNQDAIRRVYALKGRPADNPMIAHVLDSEQARRVTAGWDERCDRLARRWWPGPLTLVLTRADAVPPAATAGWHTIAVRAPAHPVARQLIEAFGGPVSAASANRSGRISPTTAEHVADDFADVQDLLVLDGGECAVGIESTVVDLTGDVAGVLRPGGIGLLELRESLGDVAFLDTGTQGPSPGTTGRHYAPRATAELVESHALHERLATLPAAAVVLCFEGTTVAPPHRAIVMPPTAADYATRLYAALREADGLVGDGRILIVRPLSDEGLWHAVGDRLRRACLSG